MAEQQDTTLARLMKGFLQFEDNIRTFDKAMRRTASVRETAAAACAAGHAA